jgi:hypothetical protein
VNGDAFVTVADPADAELVGLVVSSLTVAVLSTSWLVALSVE